jgi:hypothetical protein
MSSGWIGVDLDGTLAVYDKWVDITHIGKPVPKMLERVKNWIKNGKTVKIFTARVSSNDSNLNDEIVSHIHKWCEENGLPALEVTCKKDFGMITLYDDRCVQVRMNTGELVE